MQAIRFSHEYSKMPFEDWIPNIPLMARLLEVFIAEKNELSDGFIKYDTAYRDSGKKYNYLLSNGKLIILLLQTQNSSGCHLWTTIRRFTEKKEAYYRALRGQQIKIEIKEEM